MACWAAVIIQLTSYKRSVARRVIVLLTSETVVDACIYTKIIKHVKICYYILLSMGFVEIKIIIRGKKKIIVQEICKMFIMLYLKVIAFEYALNALANESLKRWQFVIYKTACYSIRQRNTTFLVLLVYFVFFWAIRLIWIVNPDCFNSNLEKIFNALSV